MAFKRNMVYLKFTPYRRSGKHWFWSFKNMAVMGRCGIRKPFPIGLFQPVAYNEELLARRRSVQIGDTVYVVGNKENRFAIVVKIGAYSALLWGKQRRGMFRARIDDIYFVHASLFIGSDRHSVDENLLNLQHQEEIDFIEKLSSMRFLRWQRDLALENKVVTFSEDNMCYVHRVLFKDLFDWAGKYRKTEVVVGVRDNPTLDPSKIDDELRTFFLSMARYKRSLVNPDRETIIEALVHINKQLCWIHPFADGNGRVIRIMSELFAQEMGMSIEWSFERSEKGFSKKDYHAAVRKAVSASADTRALRRLLSCFLSD
ncbi:Fic/DOC family protein [Oceanospirillum linum]|uniref:protein adenylyltransferase n=1 Tax=Oceanospirillum linum TaxID=966 RepID=A0A1T1H7W7_OCELI|nr:Fic family protein [Oceanospirillum linum]OOV85961.1 hypothetical protein BTA35_0215745 [Oceanospirillum linum]SEG44989.1 Fic/DOC family protein [Oleiphilus messinensis]